MKVSYTIIAIAGLASVASTQEAPGPSPTNSVGCEPHGDHWHCDGQISTPTAAIPSVTNPGAPSTSSTEAHEHDHEHDHEHEHDNEHDHGYEDGHDHEGEEHDGTTGSGTLPPAPTESVGCEPHEDHWHCDGPVAVATGSANGNTTGTATGTSTGTITIAPSPTESIGCEPHGIRDHWHCDGPAVTSSSLTSVAPNRTISAASTSATSTLVPANGAASQRTGHGFVATLLVLAGLFAL